MSPPAQQARVLARKRAVARVTLWFEQLWPALWPALGVLGLYMIVSLLDLPALLPAWARFVLLAAAAAAFGTGLWRGLRRVVRPDANRVDRRLERASGLRHRPLATLADQVAAPTPEARVLWQEHLRRLTAQIGRLRVGPPRPGLAAQDSMALRGALLVALAAAFVVAGPETLPRLLRGFKPTLPPAVAGPATAVQAWITPPAYTAQPPQFLRADAPAVTVPSGSHLTVSVTGGSGQPSLALDGAVEPFRALDAHSWQADRDLSNGGQLAVQRRGAVVAAWTLTVVPDQPPSAAFTEPPGPATAGGRPTQQTRLPWSAADDYGLAGLQAELRLRDRADAPALIVPIPLPGGAPRSTRGVATPDLSAHPWAGLAVRGRLVARDAPGHNGASADAVFDLPERVFENPVAQAVIAVRRQLSLTPGARREARLALDGLADRPEAFDNADGILLNLRAIGSLLARGRGPAAVDEAQARMWELALALEDGAADRTAKALEAARQELRDAMEANKETPEARAELEQKMQELREAIQRHLQTLAEQARKEGTELPYDDTAPQMNSRDLDRMAERMQDAARAGKMDDAKQQMAELERLLEQLQNARPETGEAREKQNAERRQRGKQQMDAVQDMVRREGGLVDRSQARAEPQPGTPQSGAPQPGARRPAPDQAEPGQREADARSQRALRRALGELMQQQGDLTGQVPAALGEADTAMREAGQALAEGRDTAAGAAQSRAIEALQKGGREMGQQMARQFGPGTQPGEGEGEGEGENDEPGANGQGTGPGQDRGNRPGQTAGPRPGDGQNPGRRRTVRRDPLGRPAQQGTSGAEESGDIRVPDGMEQARTRALQDELRRRGAERTRPQPELDYIDRLLKPF